MVAALVLFTSVALLIFANALYVAAEFGAVSARRSRIQELAAEGGRLAGLLLPVVQDPAALDRYVATCQIGITLSSLVLGAYGQNTLAVALAPLVSDWGRLQPVVAESTSAVVVLVVLTALQVLLGELVPKALTLQNPTSVALYTVVPMRWSMWLFRWVVAFFNGSGNFLLRPFGMSGAEQRNVHSPEELELLIAESRDGGLLEPDEQRRLHRALRFGVRSARQFMVPRTSIVALDVGWSRERILDATLATPFSRLPVYEGTIDRVIGILHTQDLILNHVQHRPPVALKDLIRPATSVPEMMTAFKLLRRFREQRTRMALVIDEFGGVAGLVTLEDVLSELLGDVGDEFHAPPVQPERLPDGRIRMSGQTPLTEVQRWLDRTWPSDADTLAGYVMEVLGRMPAQGDRIAIDGILIEVERLRGRVPGTLIVTSPPEDGAEHANR